MVLHRRLRPFRDGPEPGAAGRRVPAPEEFCDVYRELLIEHLRQQPAAPYVLVEALGEEPGYLTRGQFYWVLRYLRGANAVQWVSADYFVYENAVSDFALSDEQLSDLLLPFPMVP